MDSLPAEPLQKPLIEERRCTADPVCDDSRLVVHAVLSALCAEPRAGKARAERLEGDTMSLGNCRHALFAVADAAARDVSGGLNTGIQK